MNKVSKLQVLYEGRNVGTLALYQKHLAAFQYSDEWIADGFSISPFSLPLDKEVHIPQILPFDGLFGVFADSLPGGWGRLLVDRLLRRHGINPLEITSIERLAIVGGSGMGALQYVPELELGEENKLSNLDEIAAECSMILSTDKGNVACEEDCNGNLDGLFSLGGSSGGARPKILTEIDGQNWIIKFPALEDSPEIGLQELEYAECARACGIEMAETRLFASKKCSGYFGTKRFDRIFDEKGNARRIHVISAAGLLETSQQDLALDYDVLMKACLKLTDDFAEVERLYRLMCFNVFAHNRDDHAKNFGFLYDEAESRWKFAPAYDLTYSNSLFGEHATSVHGNGKNPGKDDLLAVAAQIGMEKTRAAAVADDVRDCVNEHLSKYLK